MLVIKSKQDTTYFVYKIYYIKLYSFTPTAVN